MRDHAEMNRQLDEAERERRCLHPTSNPAHKALLRRVRTGEIESPMPGLFIRAELWASLKPVDQLKYVVRALAQWHPDWVFGGVAAACMHGLWLEYKVVRRILQDLTVTVICEPKGTRRSSAHIERRHHAHVRSVVVDGVRVTPLAQTVAECVATMSFVDGTTLTCCALRKGVRAELVMVCAVEDGLMNDGLRKVLQYANAHAENGGEAKTFAVLIECGFVPPAQQVEFVDPQTGRRYRVDYLWRTADGRLIVVELDGLVKYTDPSMTQGRTLGGIIDDERERTEGLKRAGVHTVIRIRMEDLADRWELTRRLAEAGVPMVQQAA
ncbi:hypothetical protein [uncultured Bifidobacterium sp.]|uniref:hypothetical protein n=1 Tax=uncultured Bifidobacterium sp. TaxID=165187 RepID=UPI0025953AB9|nr:hypothetical protein [uncultured Bifidobacterium sp.]